MKILVVEAAPIFAKATVGMLRRRGHTVHWVVGYSQLDPLICVRNNGTKLQIHAGQYDLVFLDVNLKDKSQKGLDLVPALKDMNVPFFASGALADANHELVDAGAVGEVLKTTLLLALVHDEVTPNDLLDFSAVTSEKLDAITARAKEDDDYRRAGDEEIRKHI